MIRRSLALALAATLLGGTAAHAVTTVVNGVLNLRDPPFGPNERYRQYATDFLAPRFAFNPGDTLDVTLTFPGGVALDIGFLPSAVRFTTFGGGYYTSAIYTTTATLTFLNPVGSVNLTTGPQTSIADRNPAVVFTGVRNRHSGPLSIDGIRVIMRLDGVEVPVGPPEPLPPLTFSAFAVTFASDVPEPAAWMMLITGFGMVGIMARRRKIPA